MQQIYNKTQKKKWEDYDVDDDYYLGYIYKEIANIVPKQDQLKLF